MREGGKQVNHEDKSREELFTDPEEVVTFAQAYYATEFPNDDRLGCPSAGELRRAAHTGAPPDERLRSHLFACSDCFRSYRSARMSWQVQVAPAARWRDRLGAGLARLRSPRVPVAAGAFSLIFLGLIAVPLLRYRRADPPAVAVNYSSQGSPPAAPPQALDMGPALADPGRTPPDRPAAKGSPRKAGAVEARTRRQPALRVVYVDLIADDLSRGDYQSGAGRRVIILTPERQRLHLRMPRGSAAGRYTVKVVDAFGKPLLTTAAKSGGRTLTVDLDLSGLTAKSYRLCLSRGGEAPDCYLMTVLDKPSAQ
jgi:hypothetical protein